MHISKKHKKFTFQSHLTGSLKVCRHQSLYNKGISKQARKARISKSETMNHSLTDPLTGVTAIAFKKDERVESNGFRGSNNIILQACPFSPSPGLQLFSLLAQEGCPMFQAQKTHFPFSLRAKLHLSSSYLVCHFACLEKLYKRCKLFVCRFYGCVLHMELAKIDNF